MVDARHLLETFKRSNYNKMSASDASTDDTRHVFDRCSFSQQCVEKALKAALIAENKEYPWTHDLNSLFEKLSENWNINQSHFDLARLSRMYIKARYDSGDPQIILTKTDVDWSFSPACEIFESVENGLRSRGIL